MTSKKIRVWILACASSLVVLSPAQAAGVRDFTRSAPAAGASVNAAQASELTLTLTEATARPIQNWIRTAGTLDKSGRILTAFLRNSDADLVQIGQRTRAFTISTRSRMNLGKVTQITKKDGGALVEVTLPGQVPDNARYLMEIVVERGPFLSIPNVSIIEEGAKHIVYLQKEAGNYQPQQIDTGLQGELYTQVVHGLNEGDQVVSVGSFFVDAENKLKSPSMAMAAMPGMDHSSMSGMDHTIVAANAAPPSPSSGPSGIVGTDPASNATVSAPVAMIHVMFNAPVNPATSGFEVTDNRGAKIEVGETMPMGANMLMAMPKTPLPAGTYKVKWRTIGADAKPLQGEFSFTAK